MDDQIRHLWLRLEGMRRNFGLPFPLEELGFIDNHPREAFSGKGVLELCLRLGSTAEYAVDRFGDDYYRCRFPHVCLKVPEFLHETVVEQPRDAVYFRYHSGLSEAMRRAGFLEKPFCWEFQMTPAVTGLLREARELMEHSFEFGVADRLDLLAMRLFEELLIMRNSGTQSETYMDVRIQRIASYLRLHFTEEIDLDDLLRRNGLSRRNFFRFWNRSFDQPPAAFLRELKLEEGRRLLLSTDLPVLRISARLGFGNSNYFCRLFRECYGTTPQRYRK